MHMKNLNIASVLLLNALLAFVLASCTPKTSSLAAPQKITEDVPVCKESSQIYITCTDQVLLYEKKLQESVASNSILLVQFGFETCPWCHSLHDILKAATTLPKAMQIVDINIRSDSGKKVFDMIKGDYKFTAEKTGYPHLVFVNPKSKKMFHQSTGNLEDNSHGEGHDKAKVMAAIQKGFSTVQ